MYVSLLYVAYFDLTADLHNCALLSIRQFALHVKEKIYGILNRLRKEGMNQLSLIFLQ